MGQLCAENCSNWNKTKECFSVHQQSSYHLENVETASIIMKIERQQQDPIDLQLNQERKRKFWKTEISYCL